MVASYIARITAVERLNGGVLVRFESGTHIFYSAALLSTMISEAEEQDETKTLW